mmetsp:Transcript_69182/g.124719  ORF Transcript_69182/g.124719 Transcript_69182/m.124719 type:complete len:162 (+) Transcript_69182:363-848(+)
MAATCHQESVFPVTAPARHAVAALLTTARHARPAGKQFHPVIGGTPRAVRRIAMNARRALIADPGAAIAPLSTALRSATQLVLRVKALVRGNACRAAPQAGICSQIVVGSVVVTTTAHASSALSTAIVQLASDVLRMYARRQNSKAGHAGPMQTATARHRR